MTTTKGRPVRRWLQVALQLRGDLLRAVAYLDGDTGGLEGAAARAVHVRVGVADRVADGSDAGLDQRRAAGRRAAGVGAGLQRDVDRRPARPLAGRAQRADLGVVASRRLCAARADDLAVAHHEGADGGIGRTPAEGAATLIEGQLHLLGDRHRRASPPGRMRWAADGTAPAPRRAR